jgi:hypothetical protein
MSRRVVALSDLPRIDTIRPETPLRLDVAAALAYPDGSMTASGLRREHKRGRLIIERTAGEGLHDPSRYPTHEGAMPRRRHAPRLWLRRAQYDRHGRLTHGAIWLIKDGQHRESTRCGEDDCRGAEKALADYVARKHLAAVERGLRPPAAIPVADVVALYGRDVAHGHARPRETAQRLSKILEFFGDKTLADINGDRCRDYAVQRGHASAARRELEDLRAAINYHRHEGLCTAVVEVVLPSEGQARERWLTRSEAARLIWSAWRYREIQKGQPTGRRSRQHIARFLIAALYTTRRKGAILGASLSPAQGRPWVDLERGIFYGRSSAKRSKKRQPTIVVPPRLLAHLRRWRRNGQRFVVEFNGRPVRAIDKAFAANVAQAGLGDDVVPHTTRHTGITWLAIEGVDPYEICRYAGITMEMFEEVYAHHHPDFMSGVHRGFSRHRFRHRNAATKREQSASNVTKIVDYSRVIG